MSYLLYIIFSRYNIIVSGYNIKIINRSLEFCSRVRFQLPKLGLGESEFFTYVEFVQRLKFVARNKIIVSVIWQSEETRNCIEKGGPSK